eukprot:889180_1
MQQASISSFLGRSGENGDHDRNEQRDNRKRPPPDPAPRRPKSSTKRMRYSDQWKNKRLSENDWMASATREVNQILLKADTDSGFAFVDKLSLPARERSESELKEDSEFDPDKPVIGARRTVTRTEFSCIPSGHTSLPRWDDLVPPGYTSDSNYKIHRLLMAFNDFLRNDPTSSLGRPLVRNTMKSFSFDASASQVKERMGVAVRCLDSTGRRAVTVPAGLRDISRGDAVTESKTILNVIRSMYPDAPKSGDESPDQYNFRLVNYGRDGASVNEKTERLNNIDLKSGAVGQHCTAHRANLAASRTANGSFMQRSSILQTQRQFMITLISFFESSPKRNEFLLEAQRELNELAGNRGEDSVYQMARMCWTRMGYLFDCNATILKLAGSLVRACDQIFEADKNCPQADGLSRQLRDPMILYVLHILEDLRPFINQAIRTMDKDDILICDVFEHALKVKRQLEFALANTRDNELRFERSFDLETRTFDFGNSSCDLNFGRGRSRNDATLSDRLKAAKTEIIGTFTTHWCDLFLKDDGIEKDFNVLNLTTIATPGHTKDPFLRGIRSLGERFGIERDITVKGADGQDVQFHCLPTLLLSGENLQSLMDDASQAYSILVGFAKQMQNDQTNADLYEGFLRKHSGEYPAFCELVQLTLVYSTNSSMVERMFSTANNNLTKLRNRLDTRTLELLVLLHRAGPSLREFKFGVFTKWLKDSHFDLNKRSME